MASLLRAGDRSRHLGRGGRCSFVDQVRIALGGLRAGVAQQAADLAMPQPALPMMSAMLLCLLAGSR